MRTLAVSDTGSNEEANIARALRALGRSLDRQAVFAALYYHKKKVKTVGELANATGLNRKTVLTHGKHLVSTGLAEQTKVDGETAYCTIPFFQHHKRTILARKSKPTRATTKQDTRSPKQAKPRRAGKSGRKISVPAERHDVFISHASEDKKSFVEGLAERLKAEDIDVWYDKFSLKWGDSLRGQIDRGLATSRFGIVVLSKAFFNKRWPQNELDGLFALEVSGKSKILPIWHNITADEVEEFSPMLAGRLALDSAHPIEDMIAQLKEQLND